MDIDDADEQDVLDSVEGEILFFRALMRARPVGIHRHFHVMSIQSSIEKGTKHIVPIEDIWKKLESCYNLEALETLEAEYEANGSSSSTSTPQPTASPSLDENLATHPFFRSEFSLPQDPLIESEISRRRMRTTASLPSSPARDSPEPKKTGRTRTHKRKASKAEAAGLVSGDESSDLTQESGDEDGREGAETPSDRRAASLATGTEGGTDDRDEEESEDTSQDPSTTRRPRRGGRKSAGGRTRAASNARMAKKRKR